MDISWIFGHARTEFFAPTDSLSIPLIASPKPVTLLDLCKSITPPCVLNPLLFNGHLQTIWTAVKSQACPLHYRRRIFSCPDPSYPGTFAVDFATDSPAASEDSSLPPRTTHFPESEWTDVGKDTKRPLLIALHGLSGGSHELYLRHVLAPLVDPAQPEEKRWDALVVNARGCAMSKITTGVLFNARATWDAREVVRWARETWPDRKIFAVGFSLGANILTNYLGEEGENCTLQAAVVCSNPWNLEQGNLALQRTWMGREVYSKTMGGNLKDLFRSHMEEISKNPRIDVEKVLQTKYLHEFDRHLQGPTWGYPTEGAYYRDASSTDSLLAVRIPLFALHAEDDPVAVKEALPYQEVTQNPYAVLCTTSLGGHLSWFESGGGRWFVKPVEGFLRKMAEEVNMTALKSAEKALNAQPSADAKRPLFRPMRRKMHLEV